MHARHSLFALGCLLTTVACGSETIVHNLDEREANKIIELLAENEISTTKMMVDTGRTVAYTITVPSKSRIDAIRLLNRHEMPRRADMGYTEVFKDSGLIPTAGEEKAKQMAALEGEIEKQLRLVDGILDVQVQLVLPEETALRTVQETRSPTTASVTIKYLPGPGGAKPLSEPQIQAVVAGGVERLTPDNVVVVMTPAGNARNERQEAAEAMSRNQGGGGGGGGGVAGLHGISEKNMKMGLVVGVGLMLVLCISVAVSQIQKRQAQSRLARLQNEIAKARRKPTDSPPPGMQGPMG